MHSIRVDQGFHVCVLMLSDHGSGVLLRANTDIENISVYSVGIPHQSSTQQLPSQSLRSGDYFWVVRDTIIFSS